MRFQVSRRLLPLCLCFCLSSFGGASERDQSESRFDIKVPAKELEDIYIGDVVADYAALASVEGSSQVTLEELARITRFPPEFEKYVEAVSATREGLVDISCSQYRCRAISRGEAFKFAIEEIDIPLIGKPRVNLEATIIVEMRIKPALGGIEVCRIQGIKIQSGFIFVGMDGFNLDVDKEGGLLAALVDIDRGGSYPSRDCELNQG